MDDSWLDETMIGMVDMDFNVDDLLSLCEYPSSLDTLMAAARNITNGWSYIDIQL